MLHAINSIIESDGWKFAFIMRLSPLMPNEPLNYACAMTSMSLPHMAISTLGSLPKTAYEVWLASQAAIALSPDHEAHSSLDFRYVIALNVVIFLLMIVLCIQGYNKYHHYVHHSKAISKDQKHIMRRRATLSGFNAESRRRFQGHSARRPPLDFVQSVPNSPRLDIGVPPQRQRSNSCGDLGSSAMGC